MASLTSADRMTYLSAEEIKELKRASNAKAFVSFIFNWLLIASAFSLVAIEPNVVTVILALFILGGRQLGLGILLHECSHRSYFSTPRLNDFFGHWFAGLAVLTPMSFYRPYHFQHHTKTGTELDPDLKNIEQYPVTKKSMARKLKRDLVGLSGIKMLLSMLIYVIPERSGDSGTMGVNRERATGDDATVALSRAVKNFSHTFIFHSLFFCIFFLLDVPWLYGLWWLAYVFTYPVILRVRQIGEHAAMPALASDDVRETTRTTLASWWERLLFAPNYVNFHCEHHLMPTIPSYNLSRMSSMLRKRGFYEGKEYALADGGYLQVLRIASSA